jgi:hypothetical protein
MELDKLKQSSKNNIEIEGIKVPEEELILFLVNKYKEKLGDKAINSLLYSINMGAKIYGDEINGKRK